MTGKAFGSVPFPTNGLDDATLARFNGARVEVREGSPPTSLTDPAAGRLLYSYLMGAHWLRDGGGNLILDGSGNYQIDPAFPAGIAFSPVVDGAASASSFTYNKGSGPGAIASLTFFPDDGSAKWVRVYSQDLHYSVGGPTYSPLADIPFSDAWGAGYDRSIDLDPIPDLPHPGYHNVFHARHVSGGVPCRKPEYAFVVLTLTIADRLECSFFVQPPFYDAIKPFCVYAEEDGL